MNDKNLTGYVDIIMPNFNKSNFLVESIKSVLDQSYKKWFLYIIDDNSDDGSKKIIENFEKKIKILKLFF